MTNLPLSTLSLPLGLQGEMITDFIQSVITIFAIVDPIGCLPLFVGLTEQVPAENRRRLGAMAGYDAAALITAQQVHGTQLAWVSAPEAGRGALDLESAIPETDGLLTAETGVPVAILVADCAPVLIADPVGHRLAVVHAGWRGAFGRIASGAVRALGRFGGPRRDGVFIRVQHAGIHPPARAHPQHPAADRDCHRSGLDHRRPGGRVGLSCPGTLEPTFVWGEHLDSAGLAGPDGGGRNGEVRPQGCGDPGDDGKPA
jgi:hypothetical protein